MTPARLAEIHAACFGVPRPWSQAEFADLLTLPDIFLCEAKSGFAVGRIAASEAELLTLAVLPEAQRKGIGSALLADFETTAKQRGAEDLFLEVAADNYAAIYVYEAAGFVICGKRKDYYQSPKGPKISAVIYKKQIR
ncbi:MAG: GNAT family N-acetyltransferase [Rhodobacteraceae bacterium]|nr:GNAT family N-acetyltransferase [Paracoccaceae bacterium]